MLRVSCKILIIKPEEKRELSRPSRRWDIILKSLLKVQDVVVVNGIRQACDTIHLTTFIKKVISVLVP